MNITHMMKSLKQEAVESEPWLFSTLGFETVEDSYNAEHFGNSMLTLRSPDLLVQFRRDRSGTATYVASPRDQTNWWLIDFVLEVIRNEKLPLPTLDLHAGATLLRNNFDQLADALGVGFSETEERLRQKSPERIARMLEWARKQRSRLEKGVHRPRL